jgi:hypothetical protein
LVSKNTRNQSLKFSPILSISQLFIHLDFSTLDAQLTRKGLEAIFRPILKFGQAIVKAIFIKKINYEFSYEDLV